MLHEQCSASGRMLTEVVKLLMGDLRKFPIEREQEMEESVAAFKQSHAKFKDLEDVIAR